VLAFGNDEDLPVGIHRATLDEVLSILGKGSRRREFLGTRLKEIYQLVQQTGHLRRFILFGSFVTRKAEPNDLDIFLIMENAFDPSLFGGTTRSLFSHGLAQSQSAASVFWSKPSGLFSGETEEQLISYWQTKRGNTGQRGIIEIVSE
jgi:hypothetical protein